jgi:hypothetical protein
MIHVEKTPESLFIDAVGKLRPDGQDPAQMCENSLFGNGIGPHLDEAAWIGQW